MLDQLAHFLQIVEHGTFTAASKRAHLSQPALTASIHRLEGSIGARLLDRGPGGATPNAAGKAFIPWAEAALSAVESGRKAVAAVEGLETGEVRIGAGATICTYLLPAVLMAYQAEHPGILLRLRESSSKKTRSLVAAGRLDIGIVPGEGDTPWRDDDLVLVGPPSPRPGDRRHICFPPGTYIRDVLDQHFPEAEVVMELNSTTAIKGHVRAGLGIALLSESAISHDLVEGRLTRITDPRTPIRRSLSLLYGNFDRLSPAALALREALLQDLPP